MQIFSPRFSPAPRYIALLVVITDREFKNTSKKLALPRRSSLLPFFLRMFFASLFRKYWNNVISMGWKVYVPDDQLKHGFHQIDVGIPQGECSSVSTENKKWRRGIKPSQGRLQIFNGTRYVLYRYSLTRVTFRLWIATPEPLSDELELSSVLGDTRAYLYSPVLG